MIENLFINRFATITELENMSIPTLFKWHKRWDRSDKAEQNHNKEQAAKLAALNL